MSVHASPPSFAPGSLVRARGRDWVVLPESEPDLLIVRPLGGSDDEVTGIYLPLEPVAPATFPAPSVRDLGDYRSGRLFFDALRLSIRASAGPFRSFGRLAVEPRPYQLVPLLMALRLDPVRLLIADDVGIGKTIEALLIARELLDRGEAKRLAVLCPPHLAEQWAAEMTEKFHLEPELVLASTAARLERGLRIDETVFEHHPVTVVSTDFIKSDRRREEFIRTAPELVIVDEAHTCADPAGGRGSRHQRYQLVRRLADDPARHLLLVTATPHSGNETAFRELIGFLDPSFRDLPDDLGPAERTAERRRLARHFVQRRRVDIQDYLETTTPFPERVSREVTWSLSPDYRRLLERALTYARETVRDTTGGAVRQRVRWWSALAMLRSIGSSPAAAVDTLRSRAKVGDAATAEEVEELGRRSVLDLEDEPSEGTDVSPGADPGDAEAPERPERTGRRRLLALASEAAAIAGPGDPKLARGVEIVRDLLGRGRSPIVFCRFIATAEYVTDALRRALGPGIRVEAVTGLLAPEEREARVRDLIAELDRRRVLVATDCLSEGINLQEGFDAVVHYDLSWNPTRHEQREGRVDRYGQPRPSVEVVTLYGRDNPIDGIVLDVLLRKHRLIRDSLGISVPVPVDTNEVLNAILEGLLLRGRPDDRVIEQLELFDREVIEPQRRSLHAAWDAAAERERRSRSIFAHATVEVTDVRRELEAAREAVGSGPENVARFTVEALIRHGATVARRDGAIEVELADARRNRPLLDQTGLDRHGPRFRARFEPPASEGELVLVRTHPIVEGLAAFVLDQALDASPSRVAARAAVVRSAGVDVRTTALVLRLRYELAAARADHRVAEESRIVAFAGPPDAPRWLEPAAAIALFEGPPAGNVAPEQQAAEIERFNASISALEPALERYALERAGELRAAHDRVRSAGGLAGRTTVEPHLPVDILGAYIFLPAPGGGSPR